MAPGLGLTGLFQQFLDQTGGFKFVQLLHAFAEAVLGELVHLGFVELVFLGDLEDEFPLFIGAGPFVILGLLMSVAV